ncbi:MAG: hypothetical protein ABGW78_16505, partial [Pirellulales bacterium]
MALRPFDWRWIARQFKPPVQRLRRKRKKSRSDHALPERLEERRVLAFNFVSMFPSPGNLISEGTTLNEAPQQITVKFSPDVTIDPSTLNAITVTRSGGAGDAFDNGNDLIVTPGSITVDDLPNQNQVTVRFAETLVDDDYRITVNETLRSMPVIPGGPTEAFGSDSEPFTFSRGFRLDLGAQVISVVPQPVLVNKVVKVDDVSLLQDGDLLEISQGSLSYTIEFDGDGFVQNTPGAGFGTIELLSSGIPKTADQIATEIAGLLNADALSLSMVAPAAVGSEVTLSPAGEITPSLHRSYFSPKVQFTRAGLAPASSAILIEDQTALVQQKNSIVVYFNANDPLEAASAENPRNYQLLRLDDVTGDPLEVLIPDGVRYDAVNASAVLQFNPGDVTDDGLFRLRVGGSSDNNNRIDRAVNVGSVFEQQGGNAAFTTFAYVGDESATDVDLYKFHADG